jgi:hypothetical protein
MLKDKNQQSSPGTVGTVPGMSYGVGPTTWQDEF